MSVATCKPGSYEERECSRCLSGLVYDGQAGAWTECGKCSGTGRDIVFVYPKAGSGGRLRECAGCRERFMGRDLTHVGEDHPIFFEGDELCRRCAYLHCTL